MQEGHPGQSTNGDFLTRRLRDCQPNCEGTTSASNSRLCDKQMILRMTSTIFHNTIITVCRSAIGSSDIQNGRLVAQLLTCHCDASQTWQIELVMSTVDVWQRVEERKGWECGTPPPNA